MHALRSRDGDARPGTGHAVDSRSILGVQPLRPTLLDYLPAPQSREGKAGWRTRIVTMSALASRYALQDDEDLDQDEDDDFDDEEDDPDDEDDEDDDVETWQVTCSR